MENSDPRYVRSRLSFRNALVELAQVDPTRISVSLICDRTKIDRATFYRHFKDVDELVADTITDLADRAARDWQSTTDYTGTQEEAAVAILTGYFTHIADNWALYRWALGQSGFARAIHSVLQNFADSITRELSGLQSRLDPEEIQRYAAYLAGGMLGTCLHWLRQDEPADRPADLARWTLKAAYRPEPVLAGSL